MRNHNLRHSCTLLALGLVAAATGCSDDAVPPGNRNAGGSTEGGDVGPGGDVANGGPEGLSDLDGDPAGDGAGLDDDNGDVVNVDGEQDPKGLPGNDDGNGQGADDRDDDDAEALNARRSLVLIGGERIALPALESASIKALLLNGHGDAVEDELIELSILGAGAGSKLSATGWQPSDLVRVRTDADGQTRATVTAGDRTASFVVRVRHELSEALDVEVEVTAAPQGDLLVNFRLPGGSEAIQEVSINLLPAIEGEEDGDCIAADGDAPAAAHRARIVDRSDGEVLFDDLGTGNHYRVEARGLTALGDEIARGCAHAGPIQGLTVVDVDVALELDPLRFIDNLVRFDQDSRLAILDGLSESLRGHIEDLSEALAEPASFFVRPITRVVPEDFGAPFLPAGMARQAINLAAGIALEQYFRENVGDPSFARFDLAAAELLNILSQVGVRSQLTLDNTVRGASLDGTTRWSHLVLTSELFCHADPGVQGCDTVIIPLEGRAKLGVQADFDARWEAGTGEYETDEYELELDFRALFHVIFKQTILPAILADDDVTTIAQVMERLISCDRLGELIAGALGDPVLEALLTPVTTGFCRQGVYGWGQGIDEEIDALDGISSRLHMQETALLADNDGDRLLDAFANGVQDAQWMWEDVEGEPFSGSFTATTR